MNPKNMFFTSESVTEGHKDEFCEQIYYIVLDECLVQLAYCNGLVDPVTVTVNTCKTGKLSNKALSRMVRKVLISFTIILFLLCETDLYGQSPDSLQNNQINQQFWFDIFPHFSVNEKLEYYGDAGYRTIVNDSWSRIHLRPSLRYSLKRSWEIQGGVGFFYTFDSSDTNQFELRPWQGIQLNWPKTAHLSIKHLVRIEERLSYTTNNWESSFDLRFRYRLSGKVVPCTSCGLQNIFIPFYGEMFLPVNDNIVEFYRNRGRAGIGLGYNASKDWRFSLIMSWQKSRAGPEDEFDVTDYIYNLKIFKRWESRLLKK